MKPAKPEGFEVTEYGKPHNIQDAYSVIYQIVQDKGRESPQFGVRASLTGNMLKLTYMSYEMLAPSKMREITERGEECLKEMLKHIKKEFKSRARQTLELTEKKELSNYTLQKVSLNERYAYATWKMFEMV